jgi:hypothetical protein
VFWVLGFEKVEIEKCFWWGPDLKNVVYGSIEENSFGKMKSLLKSKRAGLLSWFGLGFKLPKRMLIHT